MRQEVAGSVDGRRRIRRRARRRIRLLRRRIRRLREPGYPTLPGSTPFGPPGPKERLFWPFQGQKACVRTTLVPGIPGIPVYSRVFPASPGYCTFGVSLLLFSRAGFSRRLPGTHGNTGNTGNTGNKARRACLMSNKARRACNMSNKARRASNMSNKARRAVGLISIQRPVGPYLAKRSRLLAEGAGSFGQK